MPERQFVVLSLPDPLNEYQKMCAEDAGIAAKALGLGIETVYAENQAARQAEQVYKYIRADKPNRPVAILLLPVHDKAIARVAGDAARQGIGWICLNRGVDSVKALRRDFPDLPIFGVAPDQEEIGRIQGRQFRILLPKGGKVLYVQGSTSSSSSQVRLAAVRETLAGSPVEIVDLLNGNWTADFAEMMVAGWLRMVMARKSRIDLIGCQNDQMAVGAKKALGSAAAHLNQPAIATIPVTGVDAVPAFGQRLVRQGELLASVIMPSTTKAAIEALGRALNRRQLPPEVIVLSPSSFPHEAALASRAPK